MTAQMLRTRFARDIVAEFLPPTKKVNNTKVVIICSGAPAVPVKKSVMEFFSKKGYWVFHPRYRGTWESDGKFLKLPLDRDILDIIDQLPKGFAEISINSKKRYKLQPKTIYLIGGSFGGPAQLLASRDRRVTKVVTFAPIVDWQAPSRLERLDLVWPFIQQAFGQGYRVTKKDWFKLAKGKFYNPARHIAEFDKKKIMIIHAKDDKVVVPSTVKKFAQEVDCELLLLSKGGHLSSNLIMDPRIYRKVVKFLKS